VPAVNLGQYPALTFAAWYKPATGFGTYARVFDFGNGEGIDNILVARQGTSTSLEFSLIRSGSLSQYITGADVWTTGMWRHFAWTLLPTDSTRATWCVYIDGQLIKSFVGWYPESKRLTANYVGKSSWKSDGPFVGFIDTFSVYSAALSAEEVLTLSKVRSTWLSV
jgi:hypothetical protein